MKTNTRYGWSILAAAAVGLLVGTADMTAQEMRLERAVVANAGGTISDGVITMQYTVGQPVVGTASNGTMTASIFSMGVGIPCFGSGIPQVFFSS